MADTLLSFFSADFQTLDASGNVVSTERVFGRYDGTSFTCSQEEALFTGSEAQIVAKRADCVTIEPAAPTGYKKSIRDCSGTTTDPGGGADDEPARTTDLSDEDNVKYYERPA